MIGVIHPVAKHNCAQESSGVETFLAERETKRLTGRAGITHCTTPAGRVFLHTILPPLAVRYLAISDRTGSPKTERAPLGRKPPRSTPKPARHVRRDLVTQGAPGGMSGHGSHVGTARSKLKVDGFTKPSPPAHDKYMKTNQGQMDV